MGNIIKFDEGVVEYTVNDKTTVTFNPTDLAFIDGIFSVFEYMDSKQEDIDRRLAGSEKAEDGGVMNALALRRELEAEVRERVDDLFPEADVCQSIWGKRSIFGLAGGLPGWANFLLAIMELIPAAYTAEEKKRNPRLQKYTAKYDKLRGKK